MTYTCPICGFDDMKHPAQDWNICPCCFNEFEYCDAGCSHEVLRQEWIEKGCPFIGDSFGRPEKRCPENWNPEEQLKKIKGKHIPSWKDYGQNF